MYESLREIFDIFDMPWQRIHNGVRLYNHTSCICSHSFLINDTYKLHAYICTHFHMCVRVYTRTCVRMCVVCGVYVHTAASVCVCGVCMYVFVRGMCMCFGRAVCDLCLCACEGACVCVRVSVRARVCVRACVFILTTNYIFIMAG